MRTAAWVMVAALGLGSAGVALGEGLVPSPDMVWPRWQARLSLGTNPTLLHPDFTQGDRFGLQVSGATVLGDFYFARSSHGLGSGSGFRATSGVLLGTHSSALLGASLGAAASGRGFSIGHRSLGGLSLPALGDNTDTSPTPYLGIGYTGLGKSGWGFSADLGLMAAAPGSAVKLGRVVSGSQSLDDALREMRLSPLVQVGVSYSF